MIYLKLFWSFFQIGLFGFGGGYAALPLIQNQVVNVHAWLNPQEFNDLITISQMTPGPIAINSATFIGLRMGGLAGAVIATFGNVLPCFIIVLLLSALYRRYSDLKFMQGILFALRPAIIALIGSAGISIIVTAFWDLNPVHTLATINWISVGLFALSYLLYRAFKKANPILIMLGTGILGGIIYYLMEIHII